ncbi:helix-turn-helix transcriptional regulator [Amycolatopsis ultiminotia]|uniref:Helix-turn-helix transcriptional regulator n=1 Tax=Amycolatopsis ultiminotia TaxID=543629 RepID=A0ABP6YPG2_9PSEU
MRNRLLGIALRAARENARFGVRELARRLGMNAALLSNWELGQRTPHLLDVAGLLGALGVVGEEKRRILHLARMTGPGLIVPGAQSNRDHLAALRDCEALATAITVWHPLQVPDLLQIPDYAMAVLATQGFSGKEIRQLAAIRAKSGNVILGFDGTPTTIYMGAAALTNLVGSATIMHRQLDILVVVPAATNVRIVPDDGGEHPGRFGPFTLFDTTAATMAYFSHHNAGIFIPDDSREYDGIVERLDKVAKTPLESAMLIEEAATRFAAAAEA